MFDRYAAIAGPEKGKEYAIGLANRHKNEWESIWWPGGKPNGTALFWGRVVQELEAIEV